ncbi:hypothetical protein OH76DRAFT_1093791 [Lentinus brumalis]|uniref:Uncharacterized protein n=1 Tax=Lentinus brumalis TaxID=2498619 RepID=A0A371CVY5_9APHY|nr:hypothetical protein OH76DRAFT_1093791 [Polyporus brumalis]
MYVGADGLKIDSGLGAFYLPLISNLMRLFDGILEVTFSLRPQLARVNLCAGHRGDRVLTSMVSPAAGVGWRLWQLPAHSGSSSLPFIVCPTRSFWKYSDIPRMNIQLPLAHGPAPRKPQISRHLRPRSASGPSTPGTHITAVHSLPSNRTVLPGYPFPRQNYHPVHVCTDRDRCRTSCKHGV